MASVTRPAGSDSGRCFAARLRRFGDAAALVTEADEALSYAELANRVEALADRLGPRPRLLLVEARNEPEPLIAYLAGLAGGHAVLMTAEASPRLLQTFRPDAQYRAGADGWALELAEPEGGLHPDLALLLSTSGTTGATRLVRLSAAAIDANATSIAAYLGIGLGARALTTLPIHYSYGLSVVNSHLATGGTLLLSGRSWLEPALEAQLERQQATSLAGVPHSYDLMDRIGFWDRPHPSLATLTQAGGRLPPAQVARVAGWAKAHGVRFFVMYGQTEATARIAYLPPEAAERANDCIGLAIPGGTLSLRAADGAAIDAPDVEGELIYRGPNVMMGYAETRADLARGAELEELATGDLAVKTAAGFFRITGRASRIVKPFGLRVSLDEIEAGLARRGVAAAVTGDDERIVVRAPDPPAGLAAQLASDLKLPEGLFRVEAGEIPRLASGKPDYRAILAAARAAPAPAAPPGAAVEAAFARAFGARAIDPALSFLDHGGDSLSYVRLSLDLEDLLGELPPGWESMPVAALEARARAQPARPRTWLRRIDTEIVLRAIAILAIIVNHASSYPTGGGSEVLMLLVGYSIARFQSDRFMAGAGLQVVRDLFVRVMLPYFAILALYSLLRKPVPLEHFLLLGNMQGPAGGFLEPFWFMDVLFQTYVVIALLFALPAVRALARGDPFRLGLWLIAVGFLLKFGILLWLHPVPMHLNRTPDATFLLVAFGWACWFARSLRERLTVSLLALLLAFLTAGLVPALAVWPGFQPVVGTLRAAWILAGIGLLVWVQRISVPVVLHAVATQISGSGYYIYLSHGIVVYLAVLAAAEGGHVPILLIVVAACVLGILLGRVSGLLARSLPRR
jgi:acyl-CoA synthetase (AMP-forming)/AMP-acid ligase II